MIPLEITEITWGSKLHWDQVAKTATSSWLCASTKQPKTVWQNCNNVRSKQTCS